MDGNSYEKSVSPNTYLVRVAVTLSVDILIITAIVLTVIKTRRGLAEFNSEIAKIEHREVHDTYQNIKAAYARAYDGFSPRIAIALIYFPYHRHLAEFEKQIDAEVHSGISQINIMLEANGGRFDEYTESYMKELLAARPDDGDLLKLKERWENQ